MSKINIKIEINDIKIENKGILINNILKTKDKTGTIIKYDFNTNTLNKETHFEKIEIDFNNEVMKIVLKEPNLTLNKKIVVSKLLIKNKQAIIDYQLEKEKFKLRIETTKEG